MSLGLPVAFAMGRFSELRIGLSEPRKGAEMKNRSEIWLSALEDLGSTCSVSTLEDALYVRDRVSAEGDSFFTVTLPQFGKDLEEALSTEVLSPALFKGFARRRLQLEVKLGPGDAAFNTKVKKMAWGVPLFLSGFTRRLFMEPDEIFQLVREDEVSRAYKVLSNLSYPTIGDQPSCYLINPSSEENADSMADAIFAVRQLCGLFSKEKSPAPAKAEKKAIDRYVEVDAELDLPL